MPGIAGLITRKPHTWAEPQLQRMLETLRHESSYVMGTWMDEALGVYAGSMIRKNSFADGMPLRSDRGDVTLIFSGEEYSGRETAASPGGNGSAPKSAKPGYLVDLYQSQEFPANLNGRFQGYSSTGPAESPLSSMTGTVFTACTITRPQTPSIFRRKRRRS